LLSLANNQTKEPKALFRRSGKSGTVGLQASGVARASAEDTKVPTEETQKRSRSKRDEEQRQGFIAFVVDGVICYGSISLNGETGSFSVHPLIRDDP